MSDESGNSKIISPDENFIRLYNAESRSSLHPKQKTFYWSIVHLQCCVSLRYTAKWFTYRYILFQIIFHYRLLSEVAQSCPTLCDPMDCSLPCSSIHGIFQARVLEWVAIAFSRGSSRPRDRTPVSLIVGRRFTVWASREALYRLLQDVECSSLCHSRSDCLSICV